MANIKGRRLKVQEREQGKNAHKRVNRIRYLKGLRSKTKKSTIKAMMKV